MVAPGCGESAHSRVQRPHTPMSRSCCVWSEHPSSACGHSFGDLDARILSVHSTPRMTVSRLRPLAPRDRRRGPLRSIWQAPCVMSRPIRETIENSRSGHRLVTTGQCRPSYHWGRPNEPKGGGHGSAPRAERAPAERQDALVRKRARVRRRRGARARRLRGIQARRHPQSTGSSADGRRMAGAQSPDGRRGVGDLGATRSRRRVDRLHRHRWRAHRRDDPVTKRIRIK